VRRFELGERFWAIVHADAFRHLASIDLDGNYLRATPPSASR
jgi:hypothetical protein